MPTWLLALIGEIPTLTSVVESIAVQWNSSTGSTLSKIVSTVEAEFNTTQIQALEAEAVKLFPSLSGVEAVASMLLTAAQQNNGAMSWLQTSLNAAQALGIVAFNGAGTNPGTNSPLVVDGVYGADTKAALMAFQTRFGLPTTGVLVDDENAILTALGTGGIAGAAQVAFQEFLSALKNLI